MKTYHKIKQLLDRNNEIVQIDNFSRFCKENGFPRQNFYRMKLGKAWTAHGYRMVSELEVFYTLINPHGETIATNNLVALAEEFSCDIAMLYLLAKGRIYKHNGFTNPANPPKPAYRPEYYLKNKEAINAKRRQYYQRNKDKIKSHCKTYYQKNKEAILLRRKAYNKRNKEKIAA